MATSGGEVVFTFKGDTKQLNSAVNQTGNIIKGTLASKVITSAFSAISSHMDDAIKRVDTFNQFPKVMSQFGVSADEASASIDRIDKATQGLPISLNDAVSSVQDLFMVTNDLPQAEKQFQAINDACQIFAKGSSEATSRFIYAYKQALASGKVSAQDFNQMNEAIPGLLTKVAQSMGLSTSEMKAGLSDGSISMKQFNSALLKLDQEGGAGMSAMSETARSASGGIATSLQNMSTAVTRGLGNMLNSIDTALQDNGLPGFAQMADNAKNAINNAFNSVNNVVKTVMPYVATAVQTVGPIIQSTFDNIKNAITPLIPQIQSAGETLSNVFNSVMSFLQEHQSTISTILGLIISVVGAIKLFSTVLSIFNTLKTLITGVTTAFKLLGVAFSTNPIGMIITLIAGLVAGFIYLWNNCEGFRNFWIGLWEGIKNVVSTVVGAIASFFTETIPGWWNSLIEKLAQFQLFLQEKIDSIIAFITGIPGKIWNIIVTILQFLASLPGKVWSIVSQLPGKIWNAVVQMAAKAKTGITNVKNAIVNGIKNLPNTVKNIGKNIAQGLINGIKSLLSKIKETVKKIANGIKDGLKKALKIGSPSKVMFQYGGWTTEGLINGLESLKPQLDNTVDGMFDLSPSLYGTASNNLSPQVNVTVNNNMTTDPLGQVVNTIKTFSGGAKNDYNYGRGV